MVQASNDTIGIGWRVFQAAALLVAVSWLFSYGVFGDPIGRIAAEWGATVWLLSPIISVFIILMAVAPEKLAFVNESSLAAYAARTVLLALAVLWMVNVFVGTPMITRLFAEPLAASQVLPVAGGVVLHVVFQHWFQSLAAIAFALAPERFRTITESPTPAGVQFAVINRG